MSDILILALNSKYIHSSLAPWYLKSAVSDITDSCCVIEHTINEDSEQVLSAVLSHSPEIFAVSVYIWNVEYTYRLLKMVKASLPDVKIVLGGPETSYNPKDVLLKCRDVDYIISGEGERPFTCLCEHLLFGKELDCNGISCRRGEEIFLSQPYVGSGTPKSPYTSDYFAALNGRIAYFESSRGCPYSCAYCLSGRKEGLRFFDMDYVTENLVRLANSGTKTVKFVDRTFNADRDRAIEIWRFIIDGSGRLFPCDVCFHFELSGDLVDERTVEVLKTAPQGLFQFEIGIQSFCDKTIDSIHRVTDSANLKNKIKALVSMGNSHIHTDLIAGLPYEDYNSFKKSFNDAYALCADMLQLGFLKILHGTELEALSDKYKFKFSEMPPYEVYETPWISADEIKKLKIAEKAVDRLHNSGRFRRTLALCISMFDSPFDFFFEVGAEIADASGLDGLTDTFYNFLCCRFPENKEVFRDALVCDRLATNSSKVLPKSLYRADTYLAVARRTVDKLTDATSRRSIALLYHSRQIVYAEYTKENYRGEYPLSFFPMEESKNEKN